MVSVARQMLFSILDDRKKVTLIELVKSGHFANISHLTFLLNEMSRQGYITLLNDDIIPLTYSITEKGLKENERISNEVLRLEI